MRLIFLFTFLFTASFAFGQKIHELKTDVVVPFFQLAHLSYEFIPATRIGIEGNLWYNWDEYGEYSIPPPIPSPEPIFTFIKTSLQVIIITVATKYYLFRPAPGSGAFVGGYLRGDALISPFERQYPYLFLSDYGGTVYNPPKRLLRFATGLQAGYKYVIGRHFLAEISLGMDIEPLEKHPFADWYGIPGIRLGYRL